MWGKGHPKDNPESWQDIRGFIAEFPDYAYWSQWKPMVRDFISALEARGLIDLFRIGQSMQHIVFSTLNHHQLASEPRVTLEFNPKEQTVRIAYSRANLWFNEPLSQEKIPFSTAVPKTLLYLERLWNETKPDVPIPDVLKAAN